MPTALVLDGQSGPALSVTRSLGRAGWRVLAAEGTRSARSRYGDGCTLIDATQPGFLDSVGALTTREPIDVVVPCTDASVAELWRDTLVPGGARILGGDRRSAAISLDKTRTLAAVDEVGFPTPHWIHPATESEALAAIRAMGFPSVVKPITSYVPESASLQHRRHVVVLDENEAQAALANTVRPRPCAAADPGVRPGPFARSHGCPARGTRARNGRARDTLLLAGERGHVGLETDHRPDRAGRSASCGVAPGTRLRRARRSGIPGA